MARKPPMKNPCKGVARGVHGPRSMPAAVAKPGAPLESSPGCGFRRAMAPPATRQVSVVIERRERVPGNLPKIMPVGILEVSRMAAPETSCAGLTMVPPARSASSSTAAATLRRSRLALETRRRRGYQGRCLPVRRTQTCLPVCRPGRQAGMTSGKSPRKTPLNRP